MGKRRRDSTSSESDGGRGNGSASQGGKYGYVFLAYFLSSLPDMQACLHMCIYASVPALMRTRNGASIVICISPLSVVFLVFCCCVQGLITTSTDNFQCTKTCQARYSSRAASTSSLIRGFMT